MSHHLSAEANRHAMALPSTHPTHAEIAWYVREVVELRAENERLTTQNSAAHAALNDSVGYLVYEAVIARAERAEAENAALRAASVEACALARVWVTVWNDKLSDESVQLFTQLEKQILKEVQR